MSYLEDPSAYLAGYGVGGAAIAELYIVGGYLACLIGGMLTYIFISILEKIAKKSFFNFIFVMLITGKILYSPRGEFLSFMSADRMLILFLIFTFSYKFLLATSNKKMSFKNE